MSTVKSASTTAIKQGNADPKGVTTSGSTNSGATYTFVGTSGSPTQLCIGCNQLMKQVAVNGTGDGVIVTLAGAGGSGNAYMILTLDQKVVDNDNWTVIISSPTDAGKGVTFIGGCRRRPWPIRPPTSAFWIAVSWTEQLPGPMALRSCYGVDRRTTEYSFPQVVALFLAGTRTSPP
jgi:hypothetical protein